MNSTSHLAELDLLRRQVADLSRELTERDQTLQEFTRQQDDELQDLRERSDMLRAIVAGTAAETGEDFFSTLVCHLSSVLGVQYAVVGEIQHSPVKKIRTLAVSANGNLVDNFEYPLMNTPCETALGQSFACFERDVRTVFPLFGHLAQLGVEGYCGVPLRAKGGAAMGLLVLMDTKPLRNSDRLRSLMVVFASRAAAELQRRHSETVAQQQQRQLLEAQARAHLGSWDWDLDSGIVRWSDEQFRIFGYEPGHMAVSYDTFLASLYPLDRARVQSAIDTALKGGTTYDVECRIVRPDHTIRAIHCRGEVSRDVDGHPVCMSNSVLDITDRQHSEAELRLSRERLQQTLRASGTGLWSWNTETNAVVFSEEWKRQLGYSGTELPDVLETWTSLLHPDDRERAVAYATQYRSVLDGEYRQEFRLRHKDGTYRWIEARASFVTEADGRRIHLLGSHVDITDRKRMENSVRESEQRYRTLIELSPSGVFVFCEGRTVYVNRTGALLMGAQDPQEILDRPTFEFIHPDYHQEVRESIKRLLRGGISLHSAERVYVRLDGTTIPVQVEAGQIMWDGKPAILGMFSDITERKQAEETLANLNVALERQVSDRTEALRRSEERFRQFFDHAPNVTCLKDHDGRYLYTNRQFDEVFGFAPGMALGRTDNELFSPEQAAQFETHDREVLTSGRAQEFEEVTQQRDGLRTSIVEKFPVSDTAGHLSAIGVIATDITDRKRIQGQLRLYEEIFTHSIDGIAVIDLQGQYLQQNSAHEQILGYSTQDLTGNTPAIHLGEARFAHIAQTLAAAGSYRGEIESRTKSGAPLTLDLTAFAVKDASGRPVCYVGIKRDVTERNRAQEALRESEERLRLAMEAADLGSWDVNVRTGEAVWSRRHALMQGYVPSSGPVSIQLWKDRIHPDDLERVMVDVERARKERGLFSVEHRIVWNNREEERWLSLYGRFFYDDTGVPVRFSGVSIDITEPKRAQEALKESEARWQQFAESVGSAFWIADVTPDERQVVYVNAAFTFIWGIEREEIYRSWALWFDSIHPEDRLRVKTSHDRFVSGGMTAVFHCEYRIVGRDGHIRWISDRRVRMAGRQNRIAGIAEDITHHKQQLALMAQTEAIGKIGGWQLDFLTDRLWWSEETHRLHETTAELYCPTVETALNFYTSESRPLIADALEKGVKQGTAWDLELELITAKGRRIAVRAVGKVDVVNGRAVRCYGTFQDITEHKLAGEALRQAHDDLERKVVERTAELLASQECYARATAIGKVGVWELDILNRQYHGDTNLKALFGYGSDELSTDPFAWLKLVHPEDQPIAMRNWELVQSGVAESSHYELRHIKKDGSIVWGDVRARAVRDPKGRLTHLIGATVDITERKQAEQALRESEERFSKAFRASSHPIGITELATGRCVEVNDACLLLFGFSREEVIGNTTLTLGIWPHADDRARLIERLNTGDPVRNLEMSVKTKSGEVRHVLVSCDVAELNGTLCLVTVGNDITERKRVEVALRDSEERYARATAIGKVGVWEWDLNSDQYYYGDAHLNSLFGYARGELSSEPYAWLTLVYPEDQPIALNRWEQMLGGTVQMCHVELRMVKKDGSIVWIDVRCHSVRDENGQVSRLIGAAVDITERRHAETALRESEERFSKAFRTSPHPIGITEAVTGRCIEVNDACLEVFGFRREEVIGNTTFLLGIWPKLEDRARVIERLKAGQPMRNMEFALKTKSGALRHFLASADLAELNGVLCVVTVANDITDRKHAEEALRMSEERFAKAFQASPHPVVISELDSGLVLDANEAAWQLFGYQKEEVVGHTTLEVGLWYSMDERVRYLEQLKRRGSIRNMEVQLRSKNGDVRQCLLSSELIDLNGTQCIVTVGADITERKSMERTLQLTQFSVDHAVEAILWVDQTGRIFNVNETACRMLGYARQELVTMTVPDIDPNLPVDQWVEHWNDVKEQGALGFEAKYWSRNGDVLETEVTFNYLQYDGEEYGCAILRDIGERKRAEAELRKSHKFLRQVIDTAPNLIFAKDYDGRFTMANKAVADCYGASVEDLIGKSDADFNPNGEEVNFFRQLDREVIQCAEDRFIPEERITDAEGKTRWLQTVKRPILDDEGNVRMVLGAATDITERKRIEEMLLQRERDLHAALQERERISQDLHDGILQSLYAVGLGLEACKPIIRQQPERIGTKFLGTLDQAIGQLNQVMGEVRNFIAGLESHVIQGGDFPTALRDMIRTMCSSSSARCTVRIDSAAARQLSTEQALHIINIVREGLSNALRHSGAKQIMVSLRSLRRCVRLAIQDDGVGFNTGLTQGVGHGVGNMAARAKKVRGQFALHSKPNEGTRIFLDLPKDTTYAHD